MIAVIQMMRVSVVFLLIANVHCQNGYTNQDILRLQQLTSNGNQVEAITGYSTNIMQRDPGSQSISSVNVQYHTTDDDKSDNYNRDDRGRSRKVYRIKNPFQKEQDNNDGQQDGSNTQDGNVGASDQYAAMQYSLPPEEFLKQMRAESQYYQQQSTTPATNVGYTATPQPQYQYSTNLPSGYDNVNQLQSNQMHSMDAKTSQNHQSNFNSFQYNTPNSYSMSNGQSTPSPNILYMSTPLPNSQYVGTPVNSYVSSPSTIYVSSPSNLQQYVSSPVSEIQTGTSDYKLSTTLNSNFLNYDNEQSRQLMVNHYDNSVNGMRYPNNINQEYSSSQSSISSGNQDSLRESWRNMISPTITSLSKSLQDISLSQYPNSFYNNNQQQNIHNNNYNDNINTETHRIGNIPSANNVYMNFIQPDHQTLRNLRSSTRDFESGNSNMEYSNGDYGWKLSDKKGGINYDGHSFENYPRQNLNLHNDGVAMSQMSFHIDTGKPNNYDQLTKSGLGISEVQDFTKAAAKAQDDMKIQQQYNNYASNFNTNSNNHFLTTVSSYYNEEDKQKNKLITDNVNNNIYGHTQSDFITASPFYYSNSLDNKVKQPFDHAKALKNIVPIDVSNVVQNSEFHSKDSAGLDIKEYNVPRYLKEQIEQSIKYYKPVSDSYYKDKNTGYGVNIKTKQEDILPALLKHLENNNYYGKLQSSNIPNSQAFVNYQDNMQSPANIQEGLQRPQNTIQSDISSALKVNDIPYRLTQGISNEAFRLHNSNSEQAGIPTPIPMRINQNLATHQLDVTSNIINKLRLLNKQPNIYNNINKPELDSQSSGVLTTINGIKIANPYNVDLKLVADMLKGRPAVDETRMISLRDQFTKTTPLKLDISQLEQLLMKNDNSYSNSPLNGGFGTFTNSYLDNYNTGRLPYQGVKYSRSQEEEENIPISESTNSHPIGAVIEQDEPNLEDSSTGTDLSAQGDDSNVNSYEEDRPKNTISSHHRIIGDRHKNSNPGRQLHQMKHPKLHVGEPYPLLKPPPPHQLRNKGNHNIDIYRRRRRVNKHKKSRILKNDAIFNGDNPNEEEINTMTTLLKPPPIIAEAKSDIAHDEKKS